MIPTISASLLKDRRVVELLERFGPMLEVALGDSRVGVSATWDLAANAAGRPLYRLRLRDPWGEAYAEFDRNQIEHADGLARELYKLVGRLRERESAIGGHPPLVTG